MTPEVTKDRLVGVESQELPDDLDGKDFGVGKRWGRSALTDTLSFESVVHQAEDGDNEGAKIHEKTFFTLVGLVNTERREVFYFVQVFSETCTRG